MKKSKFCCGAVTRLRRMWLLSLLLELILAWNFPFSGSGAEEPFAKIFTSDEFIVMLHFSCDMQWHRQYLRLHQNQWWPSLALLRSLLVTEVVMNVELCVVFIWTCWCCRACFACRVICMHSVYLLKFGLRWIWVIVCVACWPAAFFENDSAFHSLCRFFLLLGNFSVHLHVENPPQLLHFVFSNRVFVL